MPSFPLGSLSALDCNYAKQIIANLHNVDVHVTVFRVLLWAGRLRLSDDNSGCKDDLLRIRKATYGLW